MTNLIKDGETTKILAQLEDGVKSVFQSQTYQEYLKAMARFHKYSFGNIMLIAMQKPDATQVAGMTTWNQLGRTVRKGEHGIKILAPIITKHTVRNQLLDETGCPIVDVQTNVPVVEEQTMTVRRGYRTVSVFDISQTEGDDLPSLAQELQGRVPDYEKLKTALIQVAGCPVTFRKATNGANGYYSPGLHRIVISNQLSELHSLKTLVHEIAHSRLHCRQGTDPGNKDRSTAEVEAESVAFVTCQYLGLDSSDYSFSYLAGWSSDEQLKELRAALPVIQKTSDAIINELDALLQSTTECSPTSAVA
jgi:antirestriction protein ArdC